jgi:pyruvate dehydrogenase E2 component (dihydrolipoamide acetyltransferase)
MAESLLTMPRLGETMDEGKIAGWLVKPGDSFRRGDPIVEIETDKTIAEFPALADGTLVEILRSEGDVVTVGDPIARIEGVGETAVPETAPVEAAVVVEAPKAERLAAPTRAESERLRATPLARRLARNGGVDLSALSGSGRRGRIEKGDVLAALSGGAVEAPSGGSAAVLYAELPRGRMAYSDTGPVGAAATLLLHGFAGDRATWSGVIGGLRRAGRRVIAPDLPGHGLTDIAAEGTDDLGADLPAFLAKVAPGARVDLVAHSLGAVPAVALASAGGAASLTLIAPAGLGLDIDGAFVAGMAQARSAGEIAHLARRLTAGPTAVSKAGLAATAADMARGRLVELAESFAGFSGQTVDILDALEKLSRRMPVRIIFGVHDRIIPWQQVAGVGPLVAVHLLSASGHMPQWDQTADVVNILLAGGTAG